jgi:outer membrane protein assembly factor BamA
MVRAVPISMAALFLFLFLPTYARTQYLDSNREAIAPPLPQLLKTIEACPPVLPTPDHQSEGLHVTLSELNIEGAQQLPTADQEQIGAALRELSDIGTVDGVTSEILERVRRAWQKLGYFNVQVTGDANLLTSDAANKRIALTIHVNEGQRYWLEQINFKSHAASRDVKYLRDLFPINDGDIFDREKVAQGLEALHTAYGEMGYINFTAVQRPRLTMIPV